MSDKISSRGATSSESKPIEHIDDALAAIPTKDEINYFYLNRVPPLRWLNFQLEFRHKLKTLAEAGLSARSEIAESNYERGYKYLQQRLESLGYHGWAHDMDAEILEGRRSPPAGALERGSPSDVAREAKPGSAVPGGASLSATAESDMVPRAELEACNDDWNKRYQQWAELEEGLRAEIKGLRGFKASVDEALNMGDGTYKP